MRLVLAVAEGFQEIEFRGVAGAGYVRHRDMAPLRLLQLNLILMARLCLAGAMPGLA